MIVKVTPWYPTAKNPVSGLFVSREVLALKGAGVDIRVIHLDRELPPGKTVLENHDGVKVLRVAMNPANPVSVLRAVPIVRRAVHRARVVHSHAISALPLVALARGSKPWVHTEHWSGLSNPKSLPRLLRVVRPGFGALLELPGVVVAESARLAEAVEQYRRGKVVEIPCIVPAPAHITERLRADAGEGETAREIRLASTGGVVDRKDPLLAVRVVAVLRDRGYLPSLRWMGEGELTSEATRLAEDLGVDVKFLGFGTEEDVQNNLAQADVFLGPTKGENFFVAAAEALVAGRPLVASTKGGHVEYADPRFSEIVEERTADAYADAVERVLKRTRGVTAEEVSRSVRQRFSPEAVSQQYRELYNNVAGLGSGGLT